MNGSLEPLRTTLSTLSSIILTVFATRTGLIVFGVLVVLALAVRVAVSLRASVLQASAAGRRLGPVGAFLSALDALGAVLGKLALSVPTLLAAVAAGVAIVAASASLQKVTELADNAQRIRELQAVVRNLERRVRVADVRVTEVKNGMTKLLFMYYDPTEPGSVSTTQEISIAGTDIYFDAIVLNFRYSEIESGSETNIAIPYRVFSDVVPQNEGIVLSALDEDGVPLAFKRPDDGVYGIAPEVYRRRLAELVSMARTDEAARKEGIVRSLYGSALHKRVAAGDKIELWLEQSGGMTLQERFAF